MLSKIKRISCYVMFNVCAMMEKINTLHVSYHKYKRVTFFSETQCMCTYEAVCSWGRGAPCRLLTVSLSSLSISDSGAEL